MSDGASDNDKKTALMWEPSPRASQTLCEIVKVALPCTMGYVMTLACDVTSTMFLGRTGDQATLAATGLCSLVVNCAGLSVGIGLCGAMDTLVSQAHGAKQHELLFHIFQRCRVIVMLQLVWMVPVLWCAGDILTWLGQDPEVAGHASEYTHRAAFGLFAALQFEAIRKFLQNREDTVPPFVICGISSVLHIGWCYLFVIHLRWGNGGAACAQVITWWTRFLLGSIYLARMARREGIRLRAVLWVERPGFRDWGSYMQYALPSTMQVCSEWWFWELCSLIVGYLGKASLAAHVATMNWVGISIMPTIGFSASSATLVGNALGANMPKKAKAMAWTCLCLNLCMWTALATMFVVFDRPLSAVYTHDSEIQEIVEKLLPIWATVGFIDSSQSVLAGALKGMGRQKLLATVYIATYYGVMVPSSITTAFKLRMGIYGVWCSFGVGTALACAIYSTTLCKTNYPMLAAEASARMQQAGSQAEELARSECGSHCEMAQRSA